MSTNKVTNLINAASTEVATKETQTLIRPLSTVEHDLAINGEVVTIKKGAKVNAFELAEFISDRDNRSRTFGAQGAYALHAASEAGEGMFSEVKKQLKATLSPAALNNLVYKASLIPVKLANPDLFGQTPLSLMQDVIASFKVETTKGKVIPRIGDSDKIDVAKLLPVGKDMAKLVKSGKATQASVKEVKAKHQPVKPVEPSTSGVTMSAAEAAAEQVSLRSKVIGQNWEFIKQNSTSLDGSQRQMLVNVATDIIRMLQAK